MIKLFCISYAGGNARFFQSLIGKISDNVRCYSLDYAGHGIRRKEALYQTFDEMVEDIARLINVEIVSGDKIGVLGYSMGSLVAYEIIARNLLKVSPIHLFVAAHNAPSISSVKEPYSALSDEEFVKKLNTFGGFENIFLANTRFWPVYLPPIRNDYKLLEQYNFDKPIVRLNLKMSVLYSEQDTPLNIVKEWEKVSENVIFYSFQGNHFFLKNNENQIARLINKCLL